MTKEHSTTLVSGEQLMEAAHRKGSDEDDYYDGIRKAKDHNVDDILATQDAEARSHDHLEGEIPIQKV